MPCDVAIGILNQGLAAVAQVDAGADQLSPMVSWSRESGGVPDGRAVAAAVEN